MIKIVCVGKIKEKFFDEAIKEYKKRLSKYTKLEINEVSDEACDSIEVSMNKEAEHILKHLNEKDFVITLEIKGEPLSSVELSDKMNYLMQKNSNIVFVIGGSNGLSDKIKNRSNYSLSFSNLTFPHQLFRIILLEQIYRSFKIINNETYHK